MISKGAPSHASDLPVSTKICLGCRRDALVVFLQRNAERDILSRRPAPAVTTRDRWDVVRERGPAGNTLIMRHNCLQRAAARLVIEGQKPPREQIRRK